MNFATLDWCICVGDVVCLVALLLLLAKKALYSRFPVFFSFIGFCLLRELLLPIVIFHTNRHAYFYWYWAQAIVEYLFILGVFYELLKKVFGPLEILPPQAFKLFFIGCLFITFSLAVFGIVFPAPHLNSLLTAILYLDRGSAFLRAAILMLMLPFASLLGLRWRHYTFGIVLGLGLYSTVELVVSAVGTHVPIHLSPMVFRLTKYIPSFAYLLSMVIWMDYFRTPEPDRTEVAPGVLIGLKGVSNQLEDLYTSPVGMVRRLMWQSSLQR